MPSPRLLPVAQSSPTSNRRVNKWETGNVLNDSNQPTLFSSRNQIPNQNYGFQSNGVSNHIFKRHLEVTTLISQYGIRIQGKECN